MAKSISLYLFNNLILFISGNCEKEKMENCLLQATNIFSMKDIKFKFCDIEII